MKIKKTQNNNSLITDEIIISPTEPTGADRKKIWFRKSKNLIPSSSNVWEEGKFAHDRSWIIDDQKSIRLPSPTKVTPNTSYYISTFSSDCVFLVRIYNKNGLLLRNLAKVTDGSIITTTSDEEYFGISIIDNQENYTYEELKTKIENENIKPFLCLNSEPNKNYEDYVKPNIFIKNDNDVYEIIEEEKENELPMWHFITLDTELFSAGTVKYMKSNNIVHVIIHDLIPTRDILTTDIIANLPKPISSEVFIINSFSTSSQSRVIIDSNGDFHPHYSSLKTGNNSMQYYGNIMYLAK